MHHLGLGGRPAAAPADRLMMPVSNDTLLRGCVSCAGGLNSRLISLPLSAWTTSHSGAASDTGRLSAISNAAGQ